MKKLQMSGISLDSILSEIEEPVKSLEEEIIEIPSKAKYSFETAVKYNLEKNHAELTELEVSIRIQKRFKHATTGIFDTSRGTNNAKETQEEKLNYFKLNSK
jgi:hypothetical protein